MNRIEEIINLYWSKEIENDTAEEMLSLEVSSDELAEFIMDAFNRQWITPFNLGFEP